MRIKLTLKGHPYLFLPFNYNYILTSIIYNKLDDAEYSKSLHDSNSFKFFTFSNIFVENKQIVKNGIICCDGIFSFEIASHDEKFMKLLISNIFKDDKIKFKKENLNIIHIEFIEYSNLSQLEEFETISPILVNSSRWVDGKQKSWDLAPGARFFKNICSNLIRKYLDFYNLDETDKSIEIYSKGKFKSKRISIKYSSEKTFNRAYEMNLVLKGDVDLINFACDVGLGNKNSLRFGMIKAKSV